MRHIRKHTEFPAVIGYNRLVSDNQPTHKFLRETGIDQHEPNYILIIEFVKRFLQDLHHIDNRAYKEVINALPHKHGNDSRNKEKVHKEENPIHHKICQNLKEFSKH